MYYINNSDDIIGLYELKQVDKEDKLFFYHPNGKQFNVKAEYIDDVINRNNLKQISNTLANKLKNLSANIEKYYMQKEIAAINLRKYMDKYQEQLTNERNKSK